MRYFPSPSPISLFLALVAGSWAGVSLATGQVTLPQWSEEDWDRLEREGPDLGSFLFPGGERSPEAENIEGQGGAEDAPPPPGALSPVEDLPADLVESYFPERLEVGVLDPQSLLTQARLDGILNFLESHHRQARSAMHILVLRPTQRIPSHLDLETIHETWFGDALSVLVIYNFGNPEMSRLIFGGEASKRVPESRRANASVESINEAMVVADAEDQLERFLSELSRQLYWIEDIFHGVPAVAARASEPGPGTGTQRRAIALAWLWWSLPSIAAMLTVAGCVVAWRRRVAKRTCYFPDQPLSRRLGGAYGAGNRLVVTFGEPDERA